MKIGLFLGSFDPFTIGHDAIVKRALPLFDRIIIGVGINEHKKYMLPTEERVARIARLYANDERIEVKAYSDLAVAFAHRVQATYIIKGVRSIKDFEYERKQAEINKRIGGVETVLLVADPDVACISSSMVRELSHFGHNVDEFLPKGY